MYCKACGTQIPDDSLFCSKCGASQQGSNVPTPTAQPRWEYREISVPLGHTVEAGWYPGGAIGIDDQNIENEINRKISRKVEELAAQGWEPEGPYTIRDLSRAGQLSHHQAKN